MMRFRTSILALRLMPLFLLWGIQDNSLGYAARLRSGKRTDATTDESESVSIPVSFVETAEQWHSGATDDTSRGSHGNYYDPDMTLHTYLNSHGDHYGQQIEGIADALATGTAHILSSLVQHHGLEDRFHNIASNHVNDVTKTHRLVADFLEMSHLEKHGLAHHDMDSIHQVISAMTHRVLTKVHEDAGAPPQACSNVPDVDENEGGDEVIADAITDETNKYYDSRSKSVDSQEWNLDPTAESTWQDLESLNKIDEMEEQIRNQLDVLDSINSLKYAKAVKVFQQASKAEAQEALDTIRMFLET